MKRAGKNSQERVGNKRGDEKAATAARIKEAAKNKQLKMPPRRGTPEFNTQRRERRERGELTRIELGFITVFYICLFFFVVYLLTLAEPYLSLALCQQKFCWLVDNCRLCGTQQRLPKIREGVGQRVADSWEQLETQRGAW